MSESAMWPAKLPQTPHALVLRTDFSDDALWQEVCEEIARSSTEGYVEHYSFVSDPAWSDLPAGRMTRFDPPPHFYFIVDRFTIDHGDHPVLAIDLDKKRTEEDGAPAFRLIPSQATSLACNLNIANMDFSEFAESVDPDCIFRGFRP